MFVTTPAWDGDGTAVSSDVLGVRAAGIAVTVLPVLAVAPSGDPWDAPASG